MSMKVRRGFVAVAAALLIATACSGGSSTGNPTGSSTTAPQGPDETAGPPASTPSASTGPCALLSASEASTLTGQPMDGGKSTGGSPPTCTFAYTGSNFAQVTVQAYTGGRAACDQRLAANVVGKAPESVAAGDAGWRATDVTSFLVLKKDTCALVVWSTVKPTGANAAQVVTVMTALAARV